MSARLVPAEVRDAGRAALVAVETVLEHCGSSGVAEFALRAVAEWHALAGTTSQVVEAGVVDRVWARA